MSELDDTVRRMLESKTFEPDELTLALVNEGHDRHDVEAAIARVRVEVEAEEHSPAKLAAARRARRGAHLARLGVFTLIVGSALVLLTGFPGGLMGVLQLLLVIVVGGALIAAGSRGMRGA